MDEPVDIRGQHDSHATVDVVLVVVGVGLCGCRGAHGAAVAAALPGVVAVQLAAGVATGALEAAGVLPGAVAAGAPALPGGRQDALGQVRLPGVPGGSPGAS